MIGAVALASFLIASPPRNGADVGPRVAAAMAAAQSLQGPLDGAWLLRDTAGRPLYRFEIVDPAGGRGPLSGALRDMAGAAGAVADMRRSGRTLLFALTPPGGPVTTLRLARISRGVWMGRMAAGRTHRAVRLELAGPSPPV